MEFNLNEEETIVLEDSHFGASRKITLTNKRLVIQKKKGVFNAYWLVEHEFPFDTIEEAYTDTGGISGMSTLWVKFKDDKIIQLPIGLGGAESLGAFGAEDMVTDMAVKQNLVNNKWVNAINNQLRKNQIEQLSQIKKCFNCEKEIPQGNYAFCPFCGKSIIQ